MIFYNPQTTNTLIEQCNIEEKNIQYFLDSQKQKKKLLSECLNKVSSAIESSLEIDNVTNMLNLLEGLQQSINLSDSNSNNLNELKGNLTNLKNNLSDSITETIKQANSNKNIFDSTYEKIKEYNENYTNVQKKISDNTNHIDDFLYSFIKNCNFELQNLSLKNTNTIIQENENSKHTENIKEIENIPSVEITDNRTLLISEKSGKVFLPYYVKDIQDIFNKSPNEYTNIEDVIEKKYVVPINKYKNPFFARFKEAFMLMKNKEKASLRKCLDLALELSCNTLLNPAIITACKNLDELDIYLDYLSTNELDKFKIFNIEYDIAPSIQ